MLKVRLARTGKRGQATYRIVVMEARTSRQGKIVDNLGWYNPGLKENGLSFDKTKYEAWVTKGAQASDSVLKLILTREEKEKRWPNVAKKVVAPEKK